jgi:putative dimethyl sulfoxide reductase chaperone
MATTQITLNDVLKNRTSTYQMLTRLYMSEVDEEYLDKLRTMHFPKNTGNAHVDEGYRLIREFLNQADVNAVDILAADYVRAFLGSGVSGFSAAYPFESVYTSPKRLMMQDARDEMLALYRAAGLGKADSWKESEDHIAVQLEYMTILGTRISEKYDAGDEDGAIELLFSQKNFLEDHLLAWFPMMAKDMEKFPKTDFYRGLGKLTLGFLENDKEFLDDILAGVDYEDESAAARAKALGEKVQDDAESDEQIQGDEEKKE